MSVNIPAHAESFSLHQTESIQVRLIRKQVYTTASIYKQTQSN